MKLIATGPALPPVAARPQWRHSRSPGRRPRMAAMPVISDLIPGLSDRIDVAKLVRYGAVSVIATTTSLLVLGVLVGILAAPAAWSNVVATAVGTVPSFELNRRWVWRRRGHRSLVSELVPFAVLSFAGLALSTLAVQLAAPVAHRRSGGGEHRSVRLPVGAAVRASRPGPVPSQEASQHGRGSAASRTELRLLRSSRRPRLSGWRLGWCRPTRSGSGEGVADR